MTDFLLGGGSKKAKVTEPTVTLEEELNTVDQDDSERNEIETTAGLKHLEKVITENTKKILEGINDIKSEKKTKDTFETSFWLEIYSKHMEKLLQRFCLK